MRATCEKYFGPDINWYKMYRSELIYTKIVLLNIF